MAREGKYHRTTATEILYSFWLSFDRDGGVKLTREEPRTGHLQRAMRVETRLPLSLWNIPTIQAELTVEDTGQPEQITARLEQFSTDLKAAVGCDVVLTMLPPGADKP